MALFYNSDTFKKAGITTPPTTWDEYAADAVKIHALGPDYYIATYPPQSTGWNQALMWQAGAIWFAIQGDAWKVTINSDASKKVANFWQGLVDKGLVATVADFSNDWNAGLDSGKIASWPSAVWGQGVVKGSAAHQSGKWAVAQLPQWTPGGNVTAPWGGSAISVVSGTKHPQEAEEFVRWYLTNNDSLKIGVKEIGWYPSNKTALTFPEVTSPDAFYNNQVVDNVFINGTLNPGWTWPPNLTAVNQFMGDDFNAAITNKTGLAAALDKLQGPGCSGPERPAHQRRELKANTILWRPLGRSIISPSPSGGALLPGAASTPSTSRPRDLLPRSPYRDSSAIATAISYDEVREDGIHDDQRQPRRIRGAALPGHHRAHATAQFFQARDFLPSLTRAIPRTLRLFLLCPAFLRVLTKLLQDPAQRFGLWPPRDRLDGRG